MTFEEIQKLITMLTSSGIDELEYETADGTRLCLRKNAPVCVQAAPAAAPVLPAAAPAPLPAQAAPAPAAVPETPAAAPEDENIVTVTAPFVGTISLNDEETGNRVVKPGDKVRREDRICLIEAMKMYSDIVSPVDGEILSVEVKNGEIVEFGQPVAKIRKV